MNTDLIRTLSSTTKWNLKILISENRSMWWGKNKGIRLAWMKVSIKSLHRLIKQLSRSTRAPNKLKELLKTQIIRFWLLKLNMLLKKFISKRRLMTWIRSLRKETILRWKRLNLNRWVAKHKTLKLQPETHLLILLSFWSSDSKNGATTTRRRRTSWTCILGMSQSLRMLLLKSNWWLASPQQMKLLPPSARLKNRITPLLTTYKSSILRLITSKSRIKILRPKSRDMKSLLRCLLKIRKSLKWNSRQKLRKELPKWLKKKTRSKILRPN